MPFWWKLFHVLMSRKEKKRKKGLRISCRAYCSFFKWHHGSERVKEKAGPAHSDTWPTQWHTYTRHTRTYTARQYTRAARTHVTHARSNSRQRVCPGNGPRGARRGKEHARPWPQTKTNRPALPRLPTARRWRLFVRSRPLAPTRWPTEIRAHVPRSHCW